PAGGPVPGPPLFRQPRLSGLPSSHAALRLPPLAGNRPRARAHAPRLGLAQPAQGLSNAASRRAAGFTPDGAPVTGSAARGENMHLNVVGLVHSFLRDASGATAIEYALLAAGIGATVASTIWGVGAGVTPTSSNKLPNMF